jgi:hypothetical protein
MGDMRVARSRIRLILTFLPFHHPASKCNSAGGGLAGLACAKYSNSKFKIFVRLRDMSDER